ncbi:MAG: LutC/YkgG family protein [Ginsengibacter sp.]
MKVSSSKEKILKKIREALSNPVPLPFPKSEGSTALFPQANEDLEILFAKEFTALSGKFAFCIDEKDAQQQLKQLIAYQKWKSIFCIEKQLSPLFPPTQFPAISDISLPNCDAAITSCQYLVARTGAIVMSSAKESGRTVSAYSPVHICIAYVDQLVFDSRDVLKELKAAPNLPSSITFAAGPSRTADIEKTLVIGVHGPKEVYVFLIDQRSQK